MSRVRMLSIALGVAFALPALAGADTTAQAAAQHSARRVSTAARSAAVFPPGLIGTWQSAPDERPLNTSFDESVWGKNAKSIRTVRLAVLSTGEATLTVTNRVADARGRTVKGSTSIEEVALMLGDVERTTGVRSDLAVTVKAAERRYPDDPAGNWTIEGLKVTVTTFTDDPALLEVRLDFPEGRGSFWQTLRRGTSRRSAAMTS